jgi:hypothetical protein
MYKLPAGGSTWAAYGPVFGQGGGAGTPAAAADGRVFFTSSVGLISLDAAATAYNIESHDQGTGVVIANDGTVYAEVGVGSGTKALANTGASGAFETSQAFGVSGNGSTDPGGICRTGAGDIYAGTVPDLWQLPAGSTTWSKLVLTPSHGGNDVHCAPNGRIYLAESGTLYRSTP